MWAYADPTDMIKTGFKSKIWAVTNRLMQ